MKISNLNRIQKQIFKNAKAVLQKNWIDLGDRGGYTRPATSIYPFQWNWDSGFIAYGYAHYDIPKAITELRTLFKGQWSNGFLPHIVFHKIVKDYFPNFDFWEYYSPLSGEGIGARDFSWTAALVIDLLHHK